MKTLRQRILKFISYRQAEQIKTLFCGLLYYSGLAFLLGRLSGKDGTAILLFHSINDRDVFCDNRLSPKKFEEVLVWLKKKYRIISLEELVRQIRSGQKVSDDQVVLTFDDGYLDNVSVALPILQRHGATAVFYVPVDVLRGGRLFFYDEVQAIIDHSRKKKIEIILDGQRQIFRLDSLRAKEDAVVRMVIGIRQKTAEDRKAFIDDLRRICDPDFSAYDSTGLYMKVEDIVKLKNAGMETGSHTVTHPNLAALSGAELAGEIAGSRKMLEEILCTPVRAFSYPFGKRYTCSEQVRQAVIDAGYESATMTLFGRAGAHSDLYALPRIGVRDAALVRLKVNLLGIPL